MVRRGLFALAVCASLGACRNNVAPDIEILAPSHGDVIMSSETIAVTVSATDRSSGDVELYIDGISAGPPQSWEQHECETGCTFGFPWDTTLEDAGPRALRVVARDGLGAESEAEIAVTLEDVPLAMAISAPADPTTVDGLDTVNVVIDVDDDDPLSLTLSYNGAEVASRSYDGGDCTDGCTATIPWNTALSAEGDHTLTAVAEDAPGDTVTDSIAVSLIDTPTIAPVTPGDGAVLVGFSTIDLALAATDRSALDVEMTIDAAAPAGAPTATGGACGGGCTVSYAWDTTSYADGVHDVDVLVRDPFGRQATTSLAVTVGDIPYVSAIEITNENESNRLEVEVHLFDFDTNEHLGCSGMVGGLESVDYSDVRYTGLTGRFQRPAAAFSLSRADIASRNVYFRVYEDDGDPCPAPPGAGDDQIGTSGSIPGTDIATSPLSFGDVVYLDLRFGRPL